MDDTRYGYGRHVHGYTTHLPSNVRLNRKASVTVYMGVPWHDQGVFQGQYRALHTMWETDELPTIFRRYLPFYDQIIVPCEHNRELFARHHPNVCTVPEGIDRTLFAPRPRPHNTRFQFRAGGSQWWRKGLDVVVKAFKTLQLPDADLHIKIPKHSTEFPSENFGPNIYFHREWMTEEEQIEWFAGADCFIAVSRGEGWGLMPLQTISMAVPTIMSESSGHLEFIDLATATVPCAKTVAQVGGKWDEPDLKILMNKMLWIYKNHAEALNIAAHNAPQTDRYSWDKSTQKLVDCLPVGKLLTNPTPLDTARWQVVALARIVADIGENSYRHNKGDIFTVDEGAWQVLYDNGLIQVANPRTNPIG